MAAILQWKQDLGDYVCRLLVGMKPSFRVDDTTQPRCPFHLEIPPAYLHCSFELLVSTMLARGQVLCKRVSMPSAGNSYASSCKAFRGVVRSTRCPCQSYLGKDRRTVSRSLGSSARPLALFDFVVTAMSFTRFCQTISIVFDVRVTTRVLQPAHASNLRTL